MNFNNLRSTNQLIQLNHIYSSNTDSILAVPSDIFEINFHKHHSASNDLIGLAKVHALPQDSCVMHQRSRSDINHICNEPHLPVKCHEHKTH